MNSHSNKAIDYQLRMAPNIEHINQLVDVYSTNKNAFKICIGIQLKTLHRPRVCRCKTIHGEDRSEYSAHILSALILYIITLCYKAGNYPF